MDRENSEVKMEMQRKERLNEKGLTAYFDQMATDGRVETTVQWLVEISLLIQSDVEKRLKHAHADHTAAIITAADEALNQFDKLHDQHRIMTMTRGVSNQTVHGCSLCDELNEMRDKLTALKAALEGK